MIEWNVKLLDNVNGVKFGMSRDDARKIMALDYVEFKKNKFSENTADDFGVCHVFYDAQNNVEAVEIFEGIEISIDNIFVFPGDLNNLKKVVPDLAEEYGIYISKKCSIGVTMDDSKIESILFASKGYYE